MKELKTFLQRGGRGALARLSDKSGYNESSLHRWASGKWTPSETARENVLRILREGVDIFCIPRNKKASRKKNLHA